MTCRSMANRSISMKVLEKKLKFIDNIDQRVIKPAIMMLCGSVFNNCTKKKTLFAMVANEMFFFILRRKIEILRTSIAIRKKC